MKRMSAVTEKLLNSAQTSGSGGVLSHSSAVYSPVVVSQYQHVRNFHRLMVQWVQNPTEFAFASEWIYALTGVENVKEQVAHDMIVQQVERAHRLYPTLFQMPGGQPRPRWEASSRYGGSTTNTTSALPTDSSKLEETLVCHLSASYLCTWAMMRGQPPPVMMGGGSEGDAPTPRSQPNSNAAADEQGPPAPRSALSLVPTPELTAKPPRPPLSGGKRRVVEDEAKSRPAGQVRMDIARAVCKPNSVRLGEPPIVDVVQNVLKSHESHQQPTKQVPPRSAGGGGLSSFSIDQAKTVRQHLQESAQHAQQEAILLSLRSPRGQERLHSIHYTESTFEAAGGGTTSTSARRPRSAGVGPKSALSDVLIFGSSSHRPQAAHGVVATSTAANVVTKPRPSTASTSAWSSRLTIPSGGSAVVSVPH